MKPKGSPCRDAVGECDLDEVCNGDSGECPADLFLKNGKPCIDNNGQQGYCFNGDCPTTSQQCQVHHLVSLDSLGSLGSDDFLKHFT